MNGSQSVTSSPKWAFPFFIIWSGQAFSLLGSQLVQFALIWWLTQNTGSATVLATATLVGVLPQVILGPLTGALVDRWNRRLIMIVADSVNALAVLVLAFLYIFGLAEIWHIYLLMFIRSVAGGFHGNAMMASTSLMVPKEHLARIQGLNQVLWGSLSIVSAPLGALLLSLLPMQGILGIDVGTAILAIVPLLFIPVPQPERIANGETSQGNTSVWQDMRAGLQYVWSWKGLLFICLMATLVNFLLNPAFALMPILVKNHFNGEAIQLAAMESAFGIGMIVGGLVLSTWGGFKRRILTTLVGLLGIGVGCLTMGFLPPSAYPVAVGTMLFLGIAQPITNGPLMAAVQAAVAPEMQGRVFTLISSLAGAMSPLGLLIAGPVADLLGIQTWFILGGIGTFAMAVAGTFIPAVLNFEDGRDAAIGNEGQGAKLVEDLSIECT
jgi:DHA3 family macrolide efflux protein-like MFS transporter